MIRVFVADDHAVVRQGLTLAIQAAGDLQVVGTAADGRECMRGLAAGGIDVLVLDLSLPRVHGIEVLKRAREDHPRLPIVVLSMYPEEHYGPTAARLGATAYLSKTEPLDAILAAVRDAAAGRIPVPRAPRPSVEHRLTAREHLVLTLLVEGRTVSDIAAELDVAACTVSNHLARVKQKLGLRSIPDLVDYARRQSK